MGADAVDPVMIERAIRTGDAVLMASVDSGESLFSNRNHYARGQGISVRMNVDNGLGWGKIGEDGS